MPKIESTLERTHTILDISDLQPCVCACFKKWAVEVFHKLYHQWRSMWRYDQYPTCVDTAKSTLKHQV